ncbi:MAG: S-layer homology domain-containing protein, partial [Patescibacteria group bacterium]
MKKTNKKSAGKSLIKCIATGLPMILVAILVVVSIQVSYAQDNSPFQDVPAGNKNFLAISALYNSGIIQGFPDGTFKPNKLLGRAEFSTILAKAKGIDVTTTKNKKCFLDVKPDDWFRPYVCTLKAQKIINGYPDITFRPGNDIKRGELTQLICASEKWQTTEQANLPYSDIPSDAYYKNCVAFAKSEGFFDNILDNNASIFLPGKPVTRAEAAQFIHNAIPSVTTKSLSDMSSDNTNDEENTTASDNTVTSVAPFTPHPAEQVRGSVFEKISLSGDFPNTFYKNEVYYFQGEILTDGYSDIFAFIIDSAQKTTTYTGTVTDRHFSIPVVFHTPGNYELGIIPGKSGSSKVVNISVLDQEPQTPDSSVSQGTQATNLDAKFEDGKSTFSWTPGGATAASRLVFTQGNSKVSYMFRQQRSSFEIPFADFKDFSIGPIQWYVENATITQSMPLLVFGTAWKKSDIKNTTALEHSYRVIEKNKINVTSLDESPSSTHTLRLQAKLLARTAADAVITYPDGSVKKTAIISGNSGDIAANTSINFVYQLSQSGRYIFEINEPTGSAMLNVPIYGESGIPLVPDYFDLNNPSLDSTSAFNISSKRTELFNLINNARRAHGLQAISIDTAINEVAQAHSEDMIARNFFAHVNPDGKSPEDRRKEADITTSVQENLAKAATIRYSHEGLMRSPIHRANILDPRWTRVGLGVARSEQGYIFVSEEFSTNPITNEDVSSMRDGLVSAVNEKRAQNGLLPLTVSATLQTVTN